jgi:hypothetical protein
MTLRQIVFLTIAIIYLHPSSLSAQLNIKVGYSGAWPQDARVNEIIDKFNAGIGSLLEKPMNNFSSMHGLSVGLRYRSKKVGVEASWQSLSDRSSYTGKVNGVNGPVTVNDKWFLSETEYSLGVENYFGRFGYGASIGYGTMRIKTDISGSRKKREVVNTSAPLGKFYLIFQYPSNNVAAAIKPYIQFPLGDYDITNFDKDLFTTYDANYTSSQSYINRNTTLGISIILYNGPQEW